MQDLREKVKTRAMECLDLTIATTATVDPEELPVAAGAYLLILRLSEATHLPTRFNGLSLPEGYYVYAGSAFGSGGIRARCRRHLAPNGVLHWHVDWLTNGNCSVRVIAFPGSNECVLINHLGSLPEAGFPVPGFGSTDCRQCPSHLVQLEGKQGLHDLTVPFQLGG